ncbi:MULTISPECIES: transcriptional regulator [Myxococcus]|uniref:Transcriptional regulator n=1 Tax=Myxococcus llanfairpwllgwyngyllgogerychwyrndrobwllllantysiliogogogochensis TaxID=2590453 RepID=A0A540X9L2_9BACT|nr:MULTISPECIES: transcriptional regulator [Myxococcus]NTX04460.1 transcriptional regulator [Myxococcus sp. CA040A]TQF17983.1 transcriptional regulator [Myxococcus llanfairpwllgwyngyllgogerychwyrndrobwllllantysiliogogogochensis]
MHGADAESFELVVRSAGEQSSLRLREAPGARAAVERAVSQAAALRAAAPEPSTFARHLGAQLSRAPDPMRALERLHARDLALALSCAQGLPAACALLEQEVLLKLRVPLSRIHPSPAFADEVLQVLRANLLMPREEAPSRLLGYSGMGPLLHWVSISAVRLALRMRKAQGEESHVEAEVLAAHPAPGGLELGFVREEARGHVRAAFIRAVASLDDEDRELLRLHFVERLSLERMGALFDLHKSTLSRRLSAVQTLLEKRTRRALAERLSLPEPEVDSLMRAIHGRLDLSLSGLLAVRE